MQYALPVCGKILPFYACLGTIQRRKFTSIKHTKIMSDARTDSVWFSGCANILKVFASPMTRSKWTLFACNYSVSQDSFVAKPVLLPEKCWDVYCDILRSKNVFEKLDPGDSVMADKGFDVFLLSAYR